MSIFDVLTPDWIRTRHLAGVDLTFDDGSPYPDELFELTLEAAVDALARELGITIDDRLVKGDRYDLFQPLEDGWWQLDLVERPVRRVRAWRLRYGDLSVIEMPPSWINVLSHVHGQVCIIPDETAAIGAALHAWTTFVGSIASGHDYLPGYFELDYEAGFGGGADGTVTIPDGAREAQVTFDADEPLRYRPKLSLVTANGAAAPKARSVARDGFTVRLSTPPAGGDATVAWSYTTVPADLLEVVGMMAAMLPLDIAGDLIAGAGIASLSTSMDGLSQSINTTSSATNSGYGARVHSFADRLKAMLPRLRATYRLPDMFAI